MKLDGKVAWVTGAGSGIGRACALALAREGAMVVLTGRRREPLEETARQIGEKATVRAADVTQHEAIQAIADDIARSHGRLDVVVNNAGVNVVERRWSELTPQSVDILLATNLHSAFYVVTATLPLMRAHAGLYVHIGSRAGRFWDGPAGVGYIASKTALIALSHQLNREEGVNGVRSSVVSPGETATDILKTRRQNWTQEELALLMRPEDVGDLVGYIAGLPPRVCVAEMTVTPARNSGRT